MARSMKMWCVRERLCGYLATSTVENWDHVDRRANAVRFIETLVGRPGWWAASEVANADGAQIDFVQAERRRQR